MPRCGCPDPDAIVTGCACVVQAGPSGKITLSGTGQVGDPYVIDAAASVSRGFIDQVEYTASGTFTKASFPTAKWLRVRCVGGGGGGAGATTAAGSSVCRPGGSGGMYAESWLDIASVGASVPVTVGAGGTAGAAANGAGGDGGTSSFDSLVVAPGGSGGGAATAATTGPRITTGANIVGSGGVGQVLSRGEPGMPGIQVATGFGAGGRGGSSGQGFGSGDSGGVMNGGTGDAGNSGESGGGGGGGAVANGGAFAGGPGGAGLVIVEVWG